MRSTLILDDELVKQAKVLAAREGTTLSSIVNRSLFLLLHQPTRSAEERQPYSVITHGDPDAGDDFGPADIAALDEAMDFEGFDR